jgi:hypothetical protein
VKSVLNALAFGVPVLFTITITVKSQYAYFPDVEYFTPLKLSNLYPDYDNFEGEIKYFEWKQLRQLDGQFLKPDIEEWISTLKEVKKPDLNQKHIKVWFKDNKARYFYLQSDAHSYRYFFAVYGDSIDVVGVNRDGSLNLLLTPVGVGLWRYFYKDGRLRATKSYITDFVTENKTEFSDRLYDVENYLYFDEDREAYFDSTEYKAQFNRPVWNRHIDKKQFDYSVSGGRIWYW